MTAVITRLENGAPASEAGITATPAIAEDFIVPAERPHQRTGVALLNPATAPVTVDLEVLGSGRITIALAPGEKRAMFLFEMIKGLTANLTATVRIRASDAVAILALAGITNERGDFLMASLTGEPGSQPLVGAGRAICPRYATGDGYRTVIFMEPDSNTSIQIPVRIRFFDSGGSPQQILFR